MTPNIDARNGCYGNEEASADDGIDEEESMQINDKAIRDWAGMAIVRGGSFVQAFGRALLQADDDNFALLREVATALVRKYPKYLDWANEAIYAEGGAK